MDRFDTVVVGGGQAGLAMGYFLGRAGRSLVVLEKGRVGDVAFPALGLVHHEHPEPDVFAARRTK